MSKNRRFTLVRRPEGMPKADDFKLVEEDMPGAGPGELLVRNHYASIDPAQRGWLDDAPSYLPPVQLGDAVRATCISEVLESNAEGFKPGDWIMGLNKMEDYSVFTPDGFTNVIDPKATKSVTNYLSAMGAVGLTAWFGVKEELKPHSGQTLLVSGAAGAVGSMVGQLAKLDGAYVVGIAGGPEKCKKLLDHYRFDAAVDYRGKTVEQLTEEIGKAAPNGIDLVFENVGGTGLDATLMNINQNAKVCLCGLISEYNTEPYGTRNLWQLIVNCARIQGYLVSNYLDQFMDAGREVASLINAGKLKFDEHIDEGLENSYTAMMRLFQGTNQGKMILKIS